MAFEIEVPNLGREMGSGLVAEWYQPDGATVGIGDPLLRIEADFVAFEVEAETPGVVRHSVEPGASAAPGDVVGVILASGDRLPARNHPVETPEPAGPPRERQPRVVYRRTSSLQMARDDWGGDEPPEPPTEKQGDFAPDEVDAVRGRLVQLRQVRDDDDTPPARLVEPTHSEPVTLHSPGRNGHAHIDSDTREPTEADIDPRVIRPVDRALSVPEEPAEDPVPEPAIDRTGPIHALAPNLQPVQPSLEMRVTVQLGEAQKMCSQLSGEWRLQDIEPALEDVVVRALARALDADLVAGVDGRIVRLVSHSPQGTARCELKEAGTRLFREVVAARASCLPATPAPGVTVSSYIAARIDEARPRLERNEPLGVSVGAIRETPTGGVATITLGYAEDTVSDAAAALVLARVRELVEAPYALLAE